MLARFDYFSITAHPEVLVLQHNQFINVLKNAMLLIFSNISGVALVICYNSIVSFVVFFLFFLSLEFKTKNACHVVKKSFSCVGKCSYSITSK